VAKIKKKNKPVPKVFIVRVEMTPEDYKVLKRYKLKDADIRQKLANHAHIAVDAIIAEECTDWKEKQDYGDD